MVKSRMGERERLSGWRRRLSFSVYGPLARALGAAVIGLVPLVLGYIGLHQYLSQGTAVTAQYGHGWLDILFYDLQLPILGSAPAQGPGPYPVLLGIARLLAPAVAGAATFGALWLLLAEQMRRWSAAAARGHSIVAGDGVVALELARRLGEEHRKVVLVRASDDIPTQAHRRNPLEVRGDLADPGTLRAAGIARAAELYACASEGIVNTAIALRARDELPMTRKQRLSAYALVRDGELGVALRARRIGAAGDPRLRLDFFDIEDMAARKLLDEYPLAAGGPRQASVVIVGLGQLGRAILREVARRHPLAPGASPVEVVITRATEAQVTAVAATFPATGGSCSLRYEAATALPPGDCVVFVCLDSPDDALREGLDVAHSLAGRQGRVVVCMRESSPFTGVLAARSGLIDDVMGRLSIFGVIEEACVPADIRDDYTEQIARGIHAAYVAKETAKGNTEAVNPSMAPWERLSGDLRESNIAQAADIGTKLAEIGAVVIPRSAAAPAFKFTEQEVERLARMEHIRWMRERTAAGWKFGEQRDNDRKLHPDLRDWAYLSEEAKEKDRDTVRDLPQTLGNAGFRILRLPEEGK